MRRKMNQDDDVSEYMARKNHEINLTQPKNRLMLCTDPTRDFRPELYPERCSPWETLEALVCIETEKVLESLRVQNKRDYHYTVIVRDHQMPQCEWTIHRSFKTFQTLRTTLKTLSTSFCAACAHRFSSVLERDFPARKSIFRSIKASDIYLRGVKLPIFTMAVIKWLGFSYAIRSLGSCTDACQQARHETSHFFGITSSVIQVIREEQQRLVENNKEI